MYGTQILYPMCAQPKLSTTNAVALIKQIKNLPTRCTQDAVVSDVKAGGTCS
jgi:hypothetical protein